MNRRDFVKAIGAVAAVFGVGSKASAALPPKLPTNLWGMTTMPVGRTGSTMMVSWIGFNGCSNTQHCYNPALKVTRQHKAECYALRYDCELECRSGCYPRKVTEAIYFVGRR